MCWVKRVRYLRASSAWWYASIELVKVAGSAISIHHMMRIKNSRPFPLTKALTMAPSMAATLTLISVLRTRKKLWLTSRPISLVLHPGKTMRSSLTSERKNSRFRPTLFLFSASSPSDMDVVPRFSARSAASRAEARFCSAMRLRMRLTRPTNRAM
jgi:hypothetical protein